MIDQFKTLEPFDPNQEINPCAGIVCQDSQGRVLLQLRDDYDFVEAGGKWSLFGGGIEKDETPLMACLREVNEELGLTLREDEILPWIKTTSYIGRRWYVFKVTTPIPTSSISLSEGVGFGYLTEEQVKKFDLHPTAKAVLIELFKQK